MEHPAGNPITSYKIEQAGSEQLSWFTIHTTYGNANTVSFEHNVAQGYVYSLRITPQNSNGLGPTSNIVQFTVPDLIAPTLTLLGAKNMTMEVNTTFVEPGWTVSDNFDVLSNNDVIVSGTRHYDGSNKLNII